VAGKSTAVQLHQAYTECVLSKPLRIACRPKAWGNFDDGASTILFRVVVPKGY
jgi:hypothetical protein